MAQETIDAIRGAELAAEKTEKDAAAEGDEILARAQQKAREMIAEKTDVAKEAAAAALVQAKEQGEQQMEDALLEVGREIEVLKAIAEVKEQLVIEQILQELV